MTAANEGIKPIANNRRAFHDYAISERTEAGLVLTGTEVKSLRANGCALTDGYVKLKGREAWLVNVNIPAYEQGTFFSQHEPRRDRKLLLHARELKGLVGTLQEKGLTLVPLRMYFKRGLAKVELGLGRGKKHHDKRETIRQKEAQREAARYARRS